MVLNASDFDTLKLLVQAWRKKGANICISIMTSRTQSSWESMCSKVRPSLFCKHQHGTCGITETYRTTVTYGTTERWRMDACRWTMSRCNFLLKIVGDCYPLPGEDVHNINHELAWICEIVEWVHLFYLSICLFIYLFIKYLFTGLFIH